MLCRARLCHSMSAVCLSICLSRSATVMTYF